MKALSLIILAVLPTLGLFADSPDESIINYTEASALGAVQGITEYLPISSSGHLILANAAFDLNDETPIPGAAADKHGPYTIKRAADAYIVLLHGGTVLAIFIIYWREIIAILLGLLGRNPKGLRTGLNLLLAFIPAAIIGLLIGKTIQEIFYYPWVVSCMLIVGSIFMYSVESWYKKRHTHESERDIHNLNPLQCIAVGLLQCVAMIPGTSRSMMTIMGGYIVGLSPKKSAELSFLLGLITISAAFSYEVVFGGKQLLVGLDLGPILWGCLIAAISGALAVKWMVSYITRHGLRIFIIYRVLLAAATLWVLYLR